MPRSYRTRQNAAVPPRADDARPMYALSGVRMTDDRIYYVDHDGSCGVWILAGDIRHGQRVMLAAWNAPAAFGLGRGNAIKVDQRYMLHAILAALFDNGFIQTTG